jgi:hypothetical protein
MRLFVQAKGRLLGRCLKSLVSGKIPLYRGAFAGRFTENPVFLDLHKGEQEPVDAVIVSDSHRKEAKSQYPLNPCAVHTPECGLVTGLRSRTGMASMAQNRFSVGWQKSA